MPGTLYIVATPIGNLEDISLRAKRILSEVDLIVCEDTRVTSKLLARFEISKPLKSLHQHSDDHKLSCVAQEVLDGKNVAYVSDAGTPGVNDPGGRLVQVAMEAGIPVSPIPGPSALTTAMSVCGFPTEHFTYLGFVPHKKGRQTFFKDVASRKEAVIFFESTHRLVKTLQALSETLDVGRGTSDAGRMIFVGRELTKMHETLYRGTATEVLAQVKATSDKGEAVVIVAPKGSPASSTLSP